MSSYPFQPLLNWSDPPITGVVSAGGLLLLVSLSYLSVISVASYLALLLVTLGLAGKTYVHLMGLLNKPCEDPLAKLAQVNTNVATETVEAALSLALNVLNQTTSEMRRLLLVENIVDTVKFGVAMYLLSLVGGCVNTLTLLTIVWVLLFTLPTLYEQKKEQVDTILDQAATHYNTINDKLASFIPASKQEIKEE